MKSTSPDSTQTQFPAPTLRELCNPQEPLYQPSETIDWTEIEAELSQLNPKGNQIPSGKV